MYAFPNLLKDKKSATFVILGPDFPASIKKIQKEKLSCIGFGIVFKGALSFPRRPHLSLALAAPRRLETQPGHLIYVISLS